MRACEEANRGRWQDVLPVTDAQLARLHGCAPGDLSRWAANLMAGWLGQRIAAGAGEEAA